MASLRRVVFEGEMHAVFSPARHASAPEDHLASTRRPTAAEIESVRGLSSRFEAAELRPVSVIRAPSLDRTADPTGATRIWLAVECLQVTGSFKVRGALVAMSRLAPGKTVVAASAGNHGIGVACAAAILGVPAKVCVPASAPETKRQKIAGYGAEIVLVPSNRYDDAEAHAKELARAEGAMFLSPYDDHGVVLGNGVSLGLEIVEALGGVPEAVLAPFGGGGLATGLAWALAHEEDREEPPRRVWGVQSEASPAMALSLQEGAACLELAGDDTLAEGLEGGISLDAFDRARAAIAGVLVVREARIGAAMVHAERELGLVLEGSAAVVLVPPIHGLPPALAGGDVVCVLTGRNVDVSRLDNLRRRY